jgi:hypothetical protein
MRLQVATLTTLALIGCISPRADNATAPVEGKDYILTTESDDANARFNVSLRTLATRPLCMSIVEWPSRNGAIGGGSGIAEILSDTTKLSPHDFNYGTCIGPQCLLRVPPDQTLRGFIAYNQFGDPTIIQALPRKRLAIYSKPAFCDDVEHGRR